MLVPVCALAHVVQAALVVLDVLAALLLVQVTVLAHVLAVQVALDVVLVAQVGARADVHILVVLNVPDVADVQLVVVKVVLLHVDGIVVVVRIVALLVVVVDVAENALQPAEDVNLAREHVLRVVKVGALVALDVLVDACIHVPVDVLLAVTNVVQRVGAVAMVVLDVQGVLLHVTENVADAPVAAKVGAIATVLLLAPDVMDVRVLVMGAKIHVLVAALLAAMDVAEIARGAQVHVRAIVVHHVKLPVLDVLDALTAVQLLVLDAADVQETVLVDVRVAQRIVALDALATAQQDAAIVARQAALLLVIPIVQEHAMAHAPTRMCHLLNRLTV